MARSRVDWDNYFMAIATQVATRSTCDRKTRGRGDRPGKMILATGYNGSLRGLEHCDDVGHLMQDGHCVRTVHAGGQCAGASGSQWRADRRGWHLRHRVALLFFASS
jgi:deoxycytidylate deaminase